jgi:hypothetical protein
MQAKSRKLGSRIVSDRLRAIAHRRRSLTLGDLAPQPLNLVSLPPQTIGTFRQELPEPSVLWARVFRVPGPIFAHP